MGTDEEEPKTVSLRASIRAGEPRISATLTVVPADSIELEESGEARFLRLRNGDFKLYKRVFLVIGGERHEITQSSLPDEPRV